MTILEVFKTKLIEHNLTISTSESLTGGLLASKLTSIAGASSFYIGGEVLYQDHIKIQAGVPADIITKFGAVSKECVEAMAIVAQKRFNTSIAVALSGNAGPTASENKKVGEVYCAIRYFDQVESYQYLLKGNRNQIRNRLVQLVLINIIRHIEKGEINGKE
jgi:PncC family amidohydrolase